MNNCPCGARIVQGVIRQIEEGRALTIYQCGTCDNQFEFIYDVDPRIF